MFDQYIQKNVLEFDANFSPAQCLLAYALS